MSVTRPSQRLLLVFASLFYAYSLFFGYLHYLSPAWGYFGFTYRSPNASEISIAISLVILGSAAMPVTIARGSSMILLCLFLMVYVPSIVVSLVLDTDRLSRYGFDLFILAVSFSFVCFASQSYSSTGLEKAHAPSQRFSIAMGFVWSLCVAVLVSKFASLMKFVRFDEIYDQREIALEGTSVWLGYLQTYFATVVSPGVLAAGLCRRRPVLALMGITGSVLMYMIAAQRVVLVTPVAVVGVYFLASSRFQFLRMTTFPVLISAILTIACTAFYQESKLAMFGANTLVFRTFAMPGLMFSLYHDFFSENGYTLWSNVKGFASFIPVPDSLVNSSTQWPSLGHMIGEAVYNDPTVNLNANLFASDGLAGMGALGLVVVCLLLLYWLRVVDCSAEGWDSKFVIAVMCPVGLTLANVPLFTCMLSFGGIAWPVIFYVLKKKTEAKKEARK
jgi:hypothetical protein